MTTITKEVHYCQFCKKHSLSKSSMSRHEKYCGNNPINQHACYQNCAFLTTIKTDVPDSYSQTGSHIINKPYCAKLDKMMHSFAAVKKDLIKKYPRSFIDSELMPLECSSYERMS